MQDFVNRIPFNFEKGGETNRSVEAALKAKRAHCFEGALIAAAALSMQGRKPLLLDLKATKPDFDHVVALFREKSGWGAISKTNHAVLRYREPVYSNISELAMSYFHEYFLPDGKKTLRAFSRPFDLSRFGTEWVDSLEDLTWLAEKLDRSPHTKIILPRSMRLADTIERRAGDIEEWRK